MVNLKSLLNGAVKLGASDIHLIEGVKPYLRITGDLRRVGAPKLTANDMSKVLRTILPEHLNDVLQRERGVDFSYQLEEKARYRCIAFFQTQVWYYIWEHTGLNCNSTYNWQTEIYNFHHYKISNKE